jgi:hypothetical protein
MHLNLQPHQPAWGRKERQKIERIRDQASQEEGAPSMKEQEGHVGIKG